MAFIDDDSTEGSAFIWTIENFSCCLLEAGHCLQSPKFTLVTNKSSTYHLRVYPKGTDFFDIQNEMYYGLYQEDAFVEQRKVEFTLSIRTTDGSFKKIEDLNCEFSNFSMHGHLQFLKREELQVEAGTFLVKDTLTLRCRIVKIDGKVISPGQCYARTIIYVERIIKSWYFEEFRQNMSADEITEKVPTSSISLPKQQADLTLVLYGRANSDGKMKLEIRQTLVAGRYRRCFSTCDLYLLQAGGEVVGFVREGHWFDESEVPQVWTVPYIQLSEVLKYEKPYIRCELAIVSGNEFTWVERVENAKIDDHRPAPGNLEKPSDSLKDDLQRFHSNRMFTDMTIRTASKDFLVHKAILCARSTVFHAMFERDMKENRTGVVNIEDVDADTVQKMLLFAYSDTVEDLDCDVASKLYFAADKYRITALRRKCSEFFKKNLCVENVCEVLILSDMHQDDDLKSSAKDFVVYHATEVIRSVEWKRFTKEHASFASEIMHMLLLQNL